MAVVRGRGTWRLRHGLVGTLPVEVCPLCGALVPVTAMGQHERWHLARLDDGGPVELDEVDR